MNEIEMKLVASSKERLVMAFADDKLKKCFLNEESEEKMQAYYYDTVDFSLLKQKMAYRIRREGELLVATLKGSGKAENGLHCRLEYNHEVKDDQPDLRIFLEDGIEGTLIPEEQEQLQILFKMDFKRRKCLLGWQESTIELAYDQGFIRRKEEKLPIEELELELKEGRVEDLKEVGKYLQEKYDLHPENKSKFARGLSLLEERFDR